jgi:hypothetical protein
MKMKRLGFTRCAADLAIYYKLVKESVCYVGYYVDDGIVLSNDPKVSLKIIEEIKK